MKMVCELLLAGCIAVPLSGCGELSVEVVTPPDKLVASEGPASDSAAPSNEVADIVVVHDEIQTPEEKEILPEADFNDHKTEEAKELLPSEQAVVKSVTASGPVALDPSWEYASYSKINSGHAVMYRAEVSRKDIVIGVNAGHGTNGGTKVKTFSHPDMSPKFTGGTNAKGAVESMAVSSGMTFNDGSREAVVALATARKLRDLLLANGYDVLMVRDDDDVQLDNIARTVICNNLANCHISIHFDGDGLDHDKGCFFISTPDGLKSSVPVAFVWEKSEALGRSLVEGLRGKGCKINGNGAMAIDLTQTSYSTVPSVDIELGNQTTPHDDASLARFAEGLLAGINGYYSK
ncbi:MAG: N-acetylmuramoyl-L-alanine amidase [Lachnospiraceae bacterium]|nr:N-acetylmuramoyl-L-alanine amidase [Lachnospiraceae bacterium]